MRTYKVAATMVIVGGLFIISASTWANDWRKRANQEQKIEHLIKVMPSTANIMIELGSRYQNLYWAGKKEQWQFAKYQAEEMKSLLKKLKITRPGRAKTTSEFLEAVYPNIIQATESKNWDRFSKSFKHMRQQCIQCHKANHHGFIQPGIPGQASSPALDR